MDRRLDAVNIGCRTGSVVSVVLASAGYPGSYTKGKVIEFGTEIPEGK